MFSPEIIAKLQEVRRGTFAQYDDIILDRSAVQTLGRLFMNPDCQSDIDLLALDVLEIKLADLGAHIITAAPSALARYAEAHQLTRLSLPDMLRYYATEHADDVHDNHVAEKKSALYALAHILNVSRIVAMRGVEHNRTVDVISTTPWGDVRFNHIVIPRDMFVKLGQMIYHHFGVVITEAVEPEAGQILAVQKTDDFMAALWRESGRSAITIDFGDQEIFHKDVLGGILHPQRVAMVKNPGDLKNGRITFKN